MQKQLSRIQEHINALLNKDLRQRDRIGHLMEIFQEYVNILSSCYSKQQVETFKREERQQFLLFASLLKNNLEIQSKYFHSIVELFLSDETLIKLKIDECTTEIDGMGENINVLLLNELFEKEEKLEENNNKYSQLKTRLKKLEEIKKELDDVNLEALALSISKEEERQLPILEEKKLLVEKKNDLEKAIQVLNDGFSHLYNIFIEKSLDFNKWLCISEEKEKELKEKYAECKSDGFKEYLMANAEIASNIQKTFKNINFNFEEYSLNLSSIKSEVEEKLKKYDETLKYAYDVLENYYSDYHKARGFS